MEMVFDFIGLLNNVGAFHAIYVTLFMAFAATSVSVCFGVWAFA